MGNRLCGSVVCPPHTVSVVPPSSEGGFFTFSPAPAWSPSCGRQSCPDMNLSPSHGLQFFTNCSHKVQSFKTRLPQHRSPMSSQCWLASLLVFFSQKPPLFYPPTKTLTTNPTHRDVLAKIKVAKMYKLNV